MAERLWGGLALAFGALTYAMMINGWAGLLAWCSDATRQTETLPAADVV